VSNSVNFAAITATPLLVANTKGGNLQMISGLSTFPAQIVMSKEQASKLGITSKTPIKQRVQALKGQSVGILEVGGGLQYTLETVLKSYGLSPTAASVVAVTPYPSMLSALSRNSITAATPSVPYGDQAVKQGAVMIANVWGGDVPKIKTAPFEVVGVNKTWAAGHKTEVTEMRAALADAMKWIHANPKAAAELAHTALPAFSTSLLESSIGDGAGFSSTPTISEADFASLQSFSKVSGSDVDSVTFSSTVLNAK
jgi:ABC-type nitrate/sulfonate/bicarbonate transport system substrate-binding protein